MKKVITVLAILVVLVGAVFATVPTNSADARKADGTATIKLNAVIPEAIPQFQLKVTSGATTANADVIVGAAMDDYDKDASTPDTAKQIAYGTSNFEAAAITALTATTGTGVEVGFEINQIAKANVTAVYDITVTATELLLKSYPDGSDFSGTQTANQKFELSAATGKGASPAVATGSVGANTAGVTAAPYAEGSNKLVVTYNGAAQVDATKQLGTFTVGWKNNANAVAGNYEATVSMVVASR